MGFLFFFCGIFGPCMDLNLCRLSDCCSCCCCCGRSCGWQNQSHIGPLDTGSRRLTRLLKKFKNFQNFPHFSVPLWSLGKNSTREGPNPNSCPSRFFTHSSRMCSIDRTSPLKSPADFFRGFSKTARGCFLFLHSLNAEISALPKLYDKCRNV